MEGKSVIIYGAGVRGGCTLNALRGRGLTPVAFCDRDMRKVGHNYLGLPILSRAQVKERYGEDFYVQISPGMPVRKEIQEELLKTSFVTKEQIMNYGEYEKYRSCYSLEHAMIVMTPGISLCCALGDNRNTPPMIEWENTLDETIDKFLSIREKLISDLKAGKRDTPCEGCRELRNTYWNRGRKIESLALSPGYPCQLGCIYCDLPSNARCVKDHPEYKGLTDKIDLIALCEYLEKHQLLDVGEPVNISGGEISILPQRGKLLDFLSRYPLQIFSNAIVYDERIAKLIAREGSFLNCSIDAGTRETYAQVKGLDAFDSVLNTLKRYSEEGGNIRLKYILLSKNTSSKDVEGFLKIVEELKIPHLLVSCDITLDHTALPEDIVEAAIAITNGGRKIGAVVDVLPYFGDKNMDYIMKRTREEA